MTSRSIQVEIDVDDHLHGDRMSLIHRGLESVLPDCFDRLFVQAHAEMTKFAHVLRIALRIDDELYRDAALEVRSASLLCKLRLSRVDEGWCAYAATDAHNAAAVAAAAA